MSEVPSKEAMFDYRGTSLTRKRTPIGSYRKPMLRALWCSEGGGVSYERGTPVAVTDSGAWAALRGSATCGHYRGTSLRRKSNPP